MTSTYYDPGTGDFVMLDGNVVERSALYLVEKIKDINPDLEVLCLDPAYAESLNEEPFMICERVGDQVYKIFGVWELDDSVLERIHLSDTKRIDVFNNMVKMENQQKLDNERRYKEKKDATKDLVVSIAKNRKSSFSFIRDTDGAKVTLYEDRPVEVDLRES